MKKDVNGSVTLYLSDGVEEVLELDASGNVTRRYVFGPGVDEPIVMWEGSGVANSTRRFYRADHQGSIVALTNQDGVLQERYTYDAYGAPDNPGGQPIRYTGRRWDAETGLYYYRARYYSPALGRFLQTDPIGNKDDNNLYAYAKNQPINYLDPNGMLACFQSGTGTSGQFNLSAAQCSQVLDAAAEAFEQTNQAINDLNKLKTAVLEGTDLSSSSELASINSNFAKQFGDVTVEKIDTVTKGLEKAAAILNPQNTSALAINVSRSTPANAVAFTPFASKKVGGVRVPENSKIGIGGGFSSLFGNNNRPGSAQVETLIHEGAHFLGGSKDFQQKPINPGFSNDPRAVRNPANVACFVVNCN